MRHSTGSRPTPSSRRRGVTLIELIVTLSLVMTMVAYSVGLIGPQISYFRARINAERITSSIRYAQYIARSTNLEAADAAHGPLAANPIPAYGIALLKPGAGRLGFSYLVYRDRDPILSIRAPTGGVAGLDGPQLTYLVSLHPESILTKEYVPGTPYGSIAALPDTRIAFDAHGGLDLAGSTLSNLRSETPFSGDPATMSYAFDVVNPAFGHIRIRIRASGTVEQSGVTALQGAPQTRHGTAF